MKTYIGLNGIVVKLTDDEDKLFKYIMKVHWAGGALNRYELGRHLNWTVEKTDAQLKQLVNKGLIQGKLPTEPSGPILPGKLP